MRRAALPCRRHRRGLLLVPCVAGLLAAFVVTPSPAAQKDRTVPAAQALGARRERGQGAVRQGREAPVAPTQGNPGARGERLRAVSEAAREAHRSRGPLGHARDRRTRLPAAWSLPGLVFHVAHVRGDRPDAAQGRAAHQAELLRLRRLLRPRPAAGQLPPRREGHAHAAARDRAASAGSRGYAPVEVGGRECEQ